MKKVLTIMLCFITFNIFAFGALASTPSGVTGSGIAETQYSYRTIYPNNTLNQKLIDEWNSMTTAQKKSLIPTISPIFFRALGIYSNDGYEVISDWYNAGLATAKLTYGDADSFNSNNDVDEELKRMLTYSLRGAPNGQYYDWYSDFDEFMSMNIRQEEGVLILDSSTAIYHIYDEFIEEEQSANGLIKITMFSYKNINSSNFDNLSAYTRFIGLCNQHKDSKYVVILKNQNQYERVIRCMFPKTKPNLYNNGTTVGNTLRLCDGNGTTITHFDCYYITNNQTDWTSEGDRWTTNMRLGGATLPTGAVANTSGTQYTANFGIYTLNQDKEEMSIFTSLEGWLNNEGHYEPSYDITPNYGTVPNAVVNSNNITTYYNQKYINNGGDTVYYPPNYDPNDNTYDPERKTISFDGISNFLSSIGALIGSLINGIASGLANIVESLISIVNNLRNNLLHGVIFEFLSTFIGWLPAEITALLTGLFAVTVIFALVKLLKGFF